MTPSDPQLHRSDTPSRGRARRWATQRAVWIALAVLLVVCGSASVVLVAHFVAQNDREQAHAAFRASGAEVAATLALAIQHEEDLVVSARAYIAGNPHVSESALKGWSTAVEAFARYPELEGGGEMVPVTASQLAAFVARETAEPGSPRPAGSPFVVVPPPGSRPFFCLIALTLQRAGSPASEIPAGFDYCTEKGLLDLFIATRDSGRSAYAPYPSGSSTGLVIYTPIYRGGVVPRTVALRRRAFIGLFATTVAPQVVLGEALRSHPGVAVEFRYGSVFTHVAFRAGKIARGGQTTSIGVGSGWTMRAFGAPITAGIVHDPHALTLLIGGIAVTVLLGLLVFILGTGRSRALGMVREKTREISHRALHDSLTGLPNRALALDRGELMLARARRDPSLLPAALYVDIDRFKYVNDTFGHGAGDRLLQAIATRLTEVVRDHDTVGRLGGDEFVVLLESATHNSPPEIVAERIIEAVRRPITLADGDRPVVCSVSVGIAIGARASADELLRDADLALYTAKSAGKDRAVLFDASMQSVAEKHRRLELEVDEAIAHGEFFLEYQPIVELPTSGVIGVEALIRWRHPERGVVAPADFIPLTEETGQIMAIGRWVLQEACRQSAVWAAAGHRIGMSVNVSACQLDQDDFPEDVMRALASSAIEPSTLTLEITETALMRDVAAASKRLRGIRELGVKIALDDLGTGSSALAYLRHFAPDSMKIDRSFIAGIADSPESGAIVHTLVELGRLLGIDTLAEGIEDAEQLTRLQGERCDHGQGFLFARPTDAEGIERLLARSSADEHTRVSSY
jgi:diguanylate cyclase (GGDEF)-like protein